MNVQQSKTTTKAVPSKGDHRPLAVDLDGTLVRTDLLWESFFVLFGKSPRSWLLSIFVLLRHGVAAFKATIANQVPVAASTLPYRQSVVTFVADARKAGRRTILATGANEMHAKAVAGYLGLFDDIIASDGQTNLRSTAKAQRLQKMAPEGFDYIGDSRADLKVWEASVLAVIVASASRLAGTVQKSKNESAVHLLAKDGDCERRPGLLKLLRIRQWSKNFLIFVPILASHRWDEPVLIASSLVAFASMSLAASSTYIINDLSDVHSDRRHHRKRHRPLACGGVSPKLAVAASIIMMSAAVGLALFVSWLFLAALVGYVAATLAYSAVLKTKMFVDVLMLASFYTYRILLGGIATGIAVSQWLLLFSTFLFLSLALAKRYTELSECASPEKINLRRGYQPDDLSVLMMLGVNSGMLSAFVLCNYVSGESATNLYQGPEWLWLVTPVFLYWISRIWFMAARRQLDDDPVVFALRDRKTLMAAAICGAFFALACVAPFPKYQVHASTPTSAVIGAQ